MKVICNTDIYSTLEKGKVYEVDLWYFGLIFLKGYPYNFFKEEYFEIVEY